MKKVLITGATGLLGRALMRIFNEHGFDVIGTGFSRAQSPIVKLDLTQHITVTQFLDETKPDIIIHAAAERKPDVCENNHAHTKALNLSVTEHLSREAARLNAQFFFISTDYVFDGKAPPYSESDTLNPLNFYGETKAQGEQIVLNTSKTHSVIRVPVLYGQVETLSESAITVIAHQVKQQSNNAHDNWAIRYPTHVDDIALTLVDLCQVTNTNIGGIFHVSDNQAYTKYQIACIAAKQLEIDETTLSPINEPSQVASRPQNCALQDSRLKQLKTCHSRPFEQAFIACIQPLLTH